MDLSRITEKVMLMDDAAWARHSNPWSVSTRFSVLPFMSVAFWSREWIGLYCLLPILLSFVWIWVNPKLFCAPKKTNNWASLGTFGERVYLNRKNVPIPAQHERAALVLQSLSGLGLPIFVYGLYSLDFFALLLGNVWVMVFKAWFFDRMVWLYLDMKKRDPTYQAWFRA
jgi:hypothetical protein